MPQLDLAWDLPMTSQNQGGSLVPFRFPTDTGTTETGGGSLVPPLGGGNRVPVKPTPHPIGSAGTSSDGHNAPEQNSAGSGAPTLRWYQTAAIAAVERELETHRSTLVVLPTGTGKTVVFAELARLVCAELVRFAAGRTLVIAHRTELLEQAAKKLADVGILASIDQGAKRATSSAQVVVASLQTMRGARLLRYPPDWFAFIVVDEAHHAAAASYQGIFEHFASAKICGVTATPKRGDGKPLGDTFASVAFTLEMRRAMTEGFLAPLLAKRILVADLDLTSIRTRAGDFETEALSAAMTNEKALLGVVKPMLEIGSGRKGLVFGVDVAHAKALAEMINRFEPGSAIALDGTAKDAERRAVLSLYRRGAIRYLCNCALYTEGFDEPDIGMVVLARPTQSWTLYVQMLGRGARPAPGKVDCLVLDCVGNSAKHRLIGPIDALAGFVVDAATRAVAERKLDEGTLDLGKLLDAAEVEAEAERAAQQRKALEPAIAEYRTRVVNLFVGDQLPPYDVNAPEASRPPTAEQLAQFETLKMPLPVLGISQAEAAAILAGLAAREASGLATVGQVRMLARLRIETRGMTKPRASTLIGKFMRHPNNETLWATPWIVFSGEPEFRPGKRAA